MKTIIQQQVKDWLKTKNYEAGIAILLQHRPRMARLFSGRPARYTSKLEYELKKLAGIDHISAMAKKPKPKTPNPPINQPTNPPINQSTNPPIHKSTNPQIHQSTNPPIHQSTNPPTFSLKSAHTHIDQVPPEIERIVKEHSRLFTLRSQLSEQREKLGDSNKPAIVKQRKVITQAIHTHSERIEMLFQAHAEYLRTRTIPDIDALFPQNKPASDQGIDPKAMATERKKLLSANQRDRTWLLYNSAKKGKAPSPMPKGPRRTEIEARMAQRTERIKEIDTILKA